MEKIKLRVYSPEEKCFIDDEATKYVPVFFDNGKLKFGIIKESGLFEFPVDRYTGLKDKKEKEIYEGDIINIYLGKDIVLTERIIFSDGAFCIQNYYDGVFYTPLHYYIEDEKEYTFEVIGNIRDNYKILDTSGSA